MCGRSGLWRILQRVELFLQRLERSREDRPSQLSNALAVFDGGLDAS
jgi:hypothetical protein